MNQRRLKWFMNGDQKLKGMNYNPKSFLILGEYSLGAPMGNEQGKISINHASGESMDTDIWKLLKELGVDEQKIHSYFKKFF